MRIAQVAPLYERVPPVAYGGTERVVSYLTEELVALGHEVTLFAAGDSVTRARLIAPWPTGTRLSPETVEPLAPHILMFEQVWSLADEFDAVHFHTDFLSFPVARRIGVPNVTTLHGRLNIPELPPLYATYREIPVVSISDSQRTPLPTANWLGTVYHGVPADLYPFAPSGEDYFAFLGRISPEKRVDRAVEIARRAGRRLLVAAKVDSADREYFERDITHLLREPHVEFLGEIGEAEKGDFLGGAAALLCPIDWPEPFGLVMIEAMACGTPVIAFNLGSVPELIDDGVTGFVVRDLDEAVEAARRIDTVDRAVCRATFERRFTARRMACDYLALYERLLHGNPTGVEGSPFPLPAAAVPAPAA